MAYAKWKWMFGDSITPWRSFSNYLLTFFPSSFSLSNSQSVNIIILFVSPVLHWLHTMLHLRICDKHLYNQISHPLFHTLLVHLLLCPDWLAFRARVIIFACVFFSLLLLLLRPLHRFLLLHFTFNNTISSASRYVRSHRQFYSRARST